eukprot:216922-Pleurochrysis_carterae.AAC.3
MAVRNLLDFYRKTCLLPPFKHDENKDASKPHPYPNHWPCSTFPTWFPKSALVASKVNKKKK